MSISKQTCDRCGKKTDSTIMSMFNRAMICPECKAAERKHPAYKAAREADCAAIQQGDYNFPGIGYPGKPEKEDT